MRKIILSCLVLAVFYGCSSKQSATTTPVTMGATATPTALLTATVTPTATITATATATSTPTVTSTATVTGTPTPGIGELIDYSGNGSGDDGLDRGIYIQPYPGTSLSSITLYIAASAAGSYQYGLTVTDGQFGGTVIGTSSATVNQTGSISAAMPVSFDFPANPSVTQGDTVALALSQTSGTGSSFFDVTVTSINGASTTIVYETQETTPPLDSPRKTGVPILVSGHN